MLRSASMGLRRGTREARGARSRGGGGGDAGALPWVWLLPSAYHGGRRSGPAARLDRLVTTSVQSRELVWGGEGWTEAVRVQGTHRLGRLAVLRRIRSSRRWAGRAGSCSRLLARLPSSGRSSHVAPVLLARAANWGIVSWGGQAVTRRYWVPCTCVRLDTGFRTPSPSAREDEDESTYRSGLLMFGGV